MAHYPKPFFRPSRKLWYVQIEGKQHKLDADKAAAFKAYHALMQLRSEGKATPVMPPASLSRYVVVIVDDFLDWTEKHREPATYKWYKDRLNAFCKKIDATLTVDQLKPHHVQKWSDTYSAGSRRNLIRSIKRVLNWGEEMGYVDRSPLRHMKKPPEGKRETVITATQYQTLLENIPDQEFRDVVMTGWECGARPQELLHVEARHLDLTGNRWVFPASESKGKRTPRVVYLTPKAMEISKRLAEKHPQGVLFRNRRGRPWNPTATNSRFCRIKKKIGGAAICLYALRHTWINRMLISGVDAFTVATLAGHKNTAMLSQHYSHLSQAPGYLSAQAMRATG